MVALSSLGHRFAPVDLDDPNFERREYDRWIAYGQSKTANALFARALDARGKDQGVRAFSVHPGRIITDLSRHMSAEDLRAAGVEFDESGKPIIGPEHGLKSVAQGAATSVWAATSPQLEGHGGVYCEDCDIAVLSDDDPTAPSGIGTRASGVRQWAVDPAAAEALWALSERMTGVVM